MGSNQAGSKPTLSRRCHLSSASRHFSWARRFDAIGEWAAGGGLKLPASVYARWPFGRPEPAPSLPQE
jgi:hypothetical protein